MHLVTQLFPEFPLFNASSSHKPHTFTYLSPPPLNQLLIKRTSPTSLSPSLIIQSQPISSHSLIPRTIPPNLVSQQPTNQQSNHKLPPTSYYHHSFLLKPTSLTSFFPSLLIYTLLWCKKKPVAELGATGVVLR